LDFSEVFATIREIETGGRLMRDMKSRRRTTLLKEDSVRPVIEGQYISKPWGIQYSRAKKRYSFTSSLR